jgi:hypothetical protein
MSGAPTAPIDCGKHRAYLAIPRLLALLMFVGIRRRERVNV